MDTVLSPLPRIIEINSEMLPPHWRSLFEKDRVKLHIVLLYENMALNGKIWPAFEILMQGIARGEHNGSQVIIDSTSGNYAVALKVIVDYQNENDANFPIKRVVAVVSQSLPRGKRERLLSHGIELIDAVDQIDAMRVAERVAEERGFWYTGQYWNENNSRGYHAIAERIVEKLPMLGMVAWGIGSGGGCSGIMPLLHERFKDRSFDLRRIAVVVEDGQKVGGVRDEAALEPGSLHWRAPNIEGVRFVGEEASYRCSAALWRSGCDGGPSTGFVGEGAYLAIREMGIMRTLDEIRAADGYVHVLFPALDTYDPYRSEYEKKGIYPPR